MNKFIALITAAALTVSLCSCTGSGKTETGDEKGTESSETGKIEENDVNKVTPSDTDAMFADVDVESLPESEEGKKTVSEDFSALPEKVTASHTGDNFSMVLTFYFEDGKAVGGYVEGTYKNIAQAKTVYDSYVKNTDYYANVKREEGKITYTHTEKSFEAYKGKTVDEIKQSVKESGFEIVED